jgi:rifampin ADP-ribosylating transferase
MTYYHGGRPGRQRGAYLLPPSVTGSLSLADFGAAGVCRKDRVYVVTSYAAALLYATGQPGGVVYEVDPIGVLEPDPDCDMAGLSFSCERAKALKCVKPTRHQIDSAMIALLTK